MRLNESNDENYMPEPILKAETEEVERLRHELDACESRLRRSNADFQEFVSRVSHDLREPLRTIASYSQLLSNRMPKSDDEDSELFFRYILDGVDRAQSLLAAMVEYASAEPDRRHPARVEMNSVAFEALRRVQVPQGGSVTQDPLPAVIGDFDTLAKVLQHLIENAIKFAGRSDPQVHISAHENHGEIVIAVRDNGPGIDPAHYERIFGLFRRLHGRDVPGNGLGLAYARRAIESFGGRIWVESKLGEGSTFFFALPPAD